MGPKEKILAAQMLETASQVFSGRNCNDWDFPEGWTEEEKISLCREFHEFNGDTDLIDIDEDYFLPDWCVMLLLANKLRLAVVK